MNEGYPVLWWQLPSVDLNKKQVYIQEGDTLKLNVLPNEKIKEILGTDFKTTDFTRSSTNEENVIVNENGLVTGIKEGYGTIYGKHKVHEIYAMCIVNVAKETANPMVETGNGYTAVLKADGTVWTLRK